jgi:hypothetical protein
LLKEQLEAFDGHDAEKVAPKTSEEFRFPPVWSDFQCFGLKPYRGRTLIKDGGGKWKLHPRYTKMLTDLADRYTRRRSAL